MYKYWFIEYNKCTTLKLGVNNRKMCVCVYLREVYNKYLYYLHKFSVNLKLF